MMNTDPNGYYAASQDRTVEQLKDERDALAEALGRAHQHLEAALDALRELVRLKDGPRDDAYRTAKDAAWDAARAALPSREFGLADSVSPSANPPQTDAPKET